MLENALEHKIGIDLIVSSTLIKKAFKKTMHVLS